jgi:ATP-dependent Clp protease ATP-binding subunit ClpC
MARRFIPRWNEAGRKVLFFAQEEAGRTQTNDVAPEHILLGLLREASHPASQVLTALGVDLVGMGQDILNRIAFGPGLEGRDMKLSAQSKHVIDLCYAEAADLDNDWIGTEHLLLALVRGSGGLAGEVLAGRGVTREGCRMQIVALLQHNP